MFEPEFNKCPICGEKLVQKYNTKEKKIITLKEKLVCWERVLRCRNKECQGHSMSFHSAEYKGLVDCLINNFLYSANISVHSS